MNRRDFAQLAAGTKRLTAMWSAELRRADTGCEAGPYWLYEVASAERFQRPGG